MKQQPGSIEYEKFGLAMLPHNGAGVTLLAIYRATRRGSYREIMMVGLAGPLIAVTAVLVLGKVFGAF